MIASVWGKAFQYDTSNDVFGLAFTFELVSPLVPTRHMMLRGTDQLRHLVFGCGESHLILSGTSTERHLMEGCPR